MKITDLLAVSRRLDRRLGNQSTRNREARTALIRLAVPARERPRRWAGRLPMRRGVDLAEDVKLANLDAQALTRPEVRRAFQELFDAMREAEPNLNAIKQKEPAE